MKVREMVQWLAAFEDQDAEVEVLEHSHGVGYYDQGGTVQVVPFSPEEHATYTDMRGNRFVEPGDRWKNRRTLLLGKHDD